MTVNRVFSMLNDRMDLEKKLLLSFSGLVVLGCVVYGAVATQRTALTETVVLIGGVGAIMAGIAHYLLFKPMRRLVAVAKAVGAGDFSQRLHLERHDEFGTLAAEMDLMCDQLQAAQHASEAHIAALEQLRHSDRITTLGRLASSVAHELGNPLNVIELRAQLMASGDAVALAQAQRSATVIVEQTRRMTRIIEEILSFSRRHPAQITRVDLVGVVGKAVALCQHSSRKNKANIVLDAPKMPTEIDGDGDKLLQVFVNLLMNGIQSMPDGGTLKVTVCDEQAPPLDDPGCESRPYVCVDVADEGVGIPTDVISKVFEPFFSTKGDAGGTGLGLAVAQGIVRDHAGWISVESELGRGSSFKVHLPKPSLSAASGRAKEGARQTASTPRATA